MAWLRSGILMGLGFFCLGGSAWAEPPEPTYHVLKKITLGREGGWDYLTLDAKARRLYIARFNRVMVMDVDQEKVVGEVANTPGVHGVALVPKQGQGYASNGGDSTVTVFDLKTLREVARIKVGMRPDAILYDPASERVFTFNAGSKDATAIDVASQKVVGTIPLGGRPEFAVADGKGMVFVNLEDKEEILALDARKLSVHQRWPLAPGKEPTGLAMDRSQRRLFVTCHNEKMVILEADSGRVLATPTIGKGTDACIFDPDAHLAFSSNGDGTLTVVGENKAGEWHTMANVPTQAGARTMALDPTTHKLYLATARIKPAPANTRTPGQRRSYEPGSFVILVVGP